MSYIDKITNKDTGESRVISPAAEAVRVSNENYEGENLDEVLDEVAHAIEDAGSGDGTVTGVKIGSTTYEPTDGVVDLSSPMDNKVDKNGTDSLMTAAEHTKLGNLPTATELATQMNAKANDNAVVKTISVNGGTPATPVNGNVDISVSGGDVSKVKIGTTEYSPNESGVVDISAGVAGAQPTIDPITGNWIVGGTTTSYPSRGQDGNSGVASADGVESVNNLNGGKIDTQSKVYVLGANQGKRLRDQIDLIYQRIQSLYSLLGNIAFWDGKPAASALLPDLDWGAPKHAVAITNSLSNSVITRNGEPVSSSFQAEEGSTVTLIVAAASGYALTNVTYVKDGGSSTSATSLGDGTYKIEFVMGGSDVAITVSGTAQQAYGISYTLTGCAAPSGVTNPVSILSGGTATIQLKASSGYTMPASLPTGAVTGATAAYTRDSQDDTLATIVLSSATEDVSVNLSAVEGVPTRYLVLKALVVTNSNPDYYYLQSGEYNSNANKRAALLVKKSETLHPCEWGADDGHSADDELMDEYSTIPIPTGATKVSLQCNSTYWYGLNLVDAYGANLTGNNWIGGSTKTEIVFANYPTATHIVVNFKIGSGGTTQFSNETYQSMGIDFNIE